MLIILYIQYYLLGGVRIPRTKGAKNKKTLLKEKLLQDAKSDKSISLEKPEQKIALRLFTLEKKVHDDFINYISQFGDPKLYESYIVNELMVKYINNKLKLVKVDVGRMHNFMMAYGHVGFEPDIVKTLNEIDEFKNANRLLARKNNSFVQYQYPIFVDPDVKTSMMSKGYSTSYAVNELLKMYVEGNIKINMRISRIKEWKIKYDYVVKKYKSKNKSNHNT
jgi:hypothetical protein